jgi:hypothetical protein
MENTTMLILSNDASDTITTLTKEDCSLTREFTAPNRKKQTLVRVNIPSIFQSSNNRNKNVLTDTFFTKREFRENIDDVVFSDKDNKMSKTARMTNIGFENHFSFNF